VPLLEEPHVEATSSPNLPFFDADRTRTPAWLDANLSLNLTVLIDDRNLRFAFVEIDSEVVHGVASGVSA
jgi:hypothetical protein